MDYSKFHWWSDFMASEMGYVDENDEENDFVVGIYSPLESPNMILHINMDTYDIIESYIEED